MSTLEPLPSISPGKYRHYKGGEYEVVAVVRHSETTEPMVLYRPLYNESGMWVRSFAMFLEVAEFEGKVQPRFQLLEPRAKFTESELADTVSRMESKLSTNGNQAVAILFGQYRSLAITFERDLGNSQRDLLLAKASALMLVQEVANAKSAP